MLIFLGARATHLGLLMWSHLQCDPKRPPSQGTLSTPPSSERVASLRRSHIKANLFRLKSTTSSLWGFWKCQEKRLPSGKQTPAVQEHVIYSIFAGRLPGKASLLWLCGYSQSLITYFSHYLNGLGTSPVLSPTNELFPVLENRGKTFQTPSGYIFQTPSGYMFFLRHDICLCKIRYVLQILAAFGFDT